jgi:hypothetical protein
MKNEYLDSLTIKYTSFNSFMEMLDAAGGYRPSFYVSRRSLQDKCEVVTLANEYDDAQACRHDSRVAFRGDF